MLKLFYTLNTPYFTKSFAIFRPAIINAARVTHKSLSDLVVVMSGTGAAGSNIARMLKRLGVKTIYASNKDGVVDIRDIIKMNLFRRGKITSF